MRSRSRSARCSAGSSPPAPIKPADAIGPSVRWLGGVAIWAVELAARGAMVPLLRQRKRGSGGTRDVTASVRGALDARPSSTRRGSPTWPTPCPAACSPSTPASTPARVTRSALTGMVDAIGRDSARRIEVPAPPPVVRTATTSPKRSSPGSTAARSTRRMRVAGELVSRAEQWAALGHARARAAHRAARPARPQGGAWDLAVLAEPGTRRARLVTVEQALVRSSGHRRDRSKRSDLDDELSRASNACSPRCCGPAAPTRRGRPQPGRGVGADDRHRPRARRRRLRRARARRCRAASPRRRCGCSPSRRRRPWSAPTSSPTCAGRRCSTTSSSPRPRSRELAKEARPLVRSARQVGRARPGRPRRPRPRRSPSRAGTDPAHRRRDAAPRARPRGLAPRRRHQRRGWRLGRRPARGRRRRCPASRPPRPTGFVGELRSYQAEALAWLGFLDAAGLGGCLALDMGLGKTPTMLAHLARTARATGPALVIAPPAVVGNWAAEAARFTPEPARASCTTAPIAPPPTRSPAEVGRRRRRHHHLRHRGARHRRHRRGRVGPRRARRGAGDQEPRQRDAQQLRRIRRAHPRRAHRHADRERSRRPVGDPRLHQPRPRRTAAAVHRQLSRRTAAESPQRRGRRRAAARSTASSCSAAPRPSPRSPPSCPTASTSSTTAR